MKKLTLSLTGTGQEVIKNKVVPDGGQDPEVVPDDGQDPEVVPDGGQDPEAVIDGNQVSMLATC